MPFPRQRGHGCESAKKPWLSATTPRPPHCGQTFGAGPGFAPEILEQIGEPYVTSRPGTYAPGETDLGPAPGFETQQGMGLGFFIAKTLIEQTGGRIQVRNIPHDGARVSARWCGAQVPVRRRGSIFPRSATNGPISLRSL